MRLKKKLLKPKGPTLTDGKTLIYNEAAQQVGDLGAGPFERFDETPKFKRRENKKPLNSTNNAQQAVDGTKLSRGKDSRKSSEKGFHSGK